MCHPQIPITYEIDNQTITRYFEKPPHLKSWCYHRDDDGKKWRDFCIHALKALYKENCTLAAQNPSKDWLQNIPLERHTFDAEFRLQLKINKELRKALADKLLEEHTPKLWTNINIVAPFMTANGKKQLKHDVQSISSITKIKSIVEQKGFRLVNTVIKQKNITLTISNEQPEECHICFTSLCKDEPLCSVCKHSNMCRKCELDIKLKYGRCAFCNTAY